MTQEELNQVQVEETNNDDNLPEFDKLWNHDESVLDDDKPAKSKNDDVDDDEDEADDDIEDGEEQDNDDDDDSEEGEGQDADGEDGANNADNTNAAGEGSNDDFKLSVKFNKQDIDLNKEDAVKYAQLGMLSQKAIEQRDEYKGKLDKFEAIAKKAGMSLEEFLGNVEAKQKQLEIEDEINNLKSDEKFKDLNEDVLKEIAELRVNGKKKDVAIEQREKVDAQKALQQKEISEQVRRFQNAHPEVDINNLQNILTDEMYEMIDKGSTILEAYNTVKEKELKEKIKAQEEQIKANKLNEENRKKSIGNTHSASGDGHDPLLDILFSD